MNNDEIKEKIKSIPKVNELLEQCNENKTITNSFLTGVGVAIALTYLEIMTNQKLNPDIWIN